MLVAAGAGGDFIDAGNGNDKIDAGAGNDFIAAGKGDDSITAGAGRDIVAFNRGDGKDTLIDSGSDDAKADLISLGGGIRYADLTLRKSGMDLILGLGAGDQITLRDWYAKSGNRTIGAVQVLTEGGDYNAASNNQLHNNKAAVFDFDLIASRFDLARTSDPKLVDWAVAPSLAATVTDTSSTQARGGNLAYRYATSYGATQGYGKDMGEEAVRTELVGMASNRLQGFSIAPTGGTPPGTVDPWIALHAGTDLVIRTAPVASNPITPIDSALTDALLFAAINAAVDKPSWAVT